jgi:hypothetical protein
LGADAVNGGWGCKRCSVCIPTDRGEPEADHRSDWQAGNGLSNVNIGGASMRSIAIAVVLAAGIGLAGTSSTFAAPANGTVLGEMAGTNSSVEQVWCRVWRRCWHRTYTSYRWCRWWRRCWY